MIIKNVRRTITIAKEFDLNILEATLLTNEEARQLPKRLRRYNKYWWLRSPGYTHDFAANVDYENVDGTGSFVKMHDIAVRPVLIISNLKSSNLEIGDTFEFGNKMFEIISDDKAFCLTDIGTSAFREDFKADDANNYEKSDVKKFIDEWFKRV